MNNKLNVFKKDEELDDKCLEYAYKILKTLHEDDFLDAVLDMEYIENECDVVRVKGTAVYIKYVKNRIKFYIGELLSAWLADGCNKTEEILKEFNAKE